MFLFPPTEFELPTNLEIKMTEHNPNFKESAGISSVPTHPEFHLISRASYF